jgi:hypothetical protein
MIPGSTSPAQSGIGPVSVDRRGLFVSIRGSISAKASPETNQGGQMRLIAYMLAAVAAAALAGCAGSQTAGADAGGSQAQLMLAKRGGFVSTPPEHLRLVKINRRRCISRSVKRIAGHLKMADYLKTWKEGGTISARIR